MAAMATSQQSGPAALPDVALVVSPAPDALLTLPPPIGCSISHRGRGRGNG